MNVYFIKMADLIEMPISVVCHVGPRNRVLDGVPDPPQEGANFGEKWDGTK